MLGVAAMSGDGGEQHREGHPAADEGGAPQGRAAAGRRTCRPGSGSAPPRSCCPTRARAAGQDAALDQLARGRATSPATPSPAVAVHGARRRAAVACCTTLAPLFVVVVLVTVAVGRGAGRHPRPRKAQAARQAVQPVNGGQADVRRAGLVAGRQDAAQDRRRRRSCCSSVVQGARARCSWRRASCRCRSCSASRRAAPRRSCAAAIVGGHRCWRSPTSSSSCGATASRRG